MLLMRARITRTASIFSENCLANARIIALMPYTQLTKTENTPVVKKYKPILFPKENNYSNTPHKLIKCEQYLTSTVQQYWKEVLAMKKITICSIASKQGQNKQKSVGYFSA